MVGRVKRLLVVDVSSIGTGSGHEALGIQRVQARDRAGLDIGEIEVGQRPGPYRRQGVILRLSCARTAAIFRIPSARQHRAVVWQFTDDAWMVRPVPERRLEDDALIVPFTLSFGLDTVATRRPLLAALDAPFPTREAAGLCPLPHLGVRRGARAITGW